MDRARWAGGASVAQLRTPSRRRSRVPPAVEAHAVIEAAAAALASGRRARSSGAMPCTALLEGVGALWGLEPDAVEGAPTVAPVVPPGWPGHALRGLRVGRTVLDLEVRERPAAIVVRVTHRFGPRLVSDRPRAPGVDAIGADVEDDVPLRGPAGSASSRTTATRCGFIVPDKPGARLRNVRHDVRFPHPVPAQGSR